MSLPELERWAVRIFETTKARLPDFELVWNYRSKRRGCGAANVVRVAGREVHGVLITTDRAGLERLDDKEGVHHGRYHRTEELIDAVGRAWVYQVTADFIEPHPVKPSREYLDLLLEGARAHDLPADYISQLERVEVA
jgi:hypothetical protein